MKKLIITTIILLSISYVFSQESERNNASFSLGDGISFSFNEGDYEFNIYGFIKPTYIYNDEKIYTADGEYSNIFRQFKSQNSNLFFTGYAKEEKLSFTIQMDYSSSNPLVEAFIGYHFNKKTSLYFGQMQVSHNNLEMVQIANMVNAQFKNKFKIKWYGSKDFRSYFVSFNKIKNLGFKGKYKPSDGMKEIIKKLESKKIDLNEKTITLDWYEKIENWKRIIDNISINDKLLKK